MLALSRLARAAAKAALVVAFCSSSTYAQSPEQECLPGFCGSWSEAYDWGIKTCSFFDQDSACPTFWCAGDPHGEIPHAVLVLKNPTASPPEWRVLIVNTGHQDQSTQTWWIWDPATPGDLQPGVPNVPEVVFCSGHTVLPDGRVFFAGGQKWPSVPGGDCLGTGPTWTWVYDPVTNAWAKGPDMAKTRYYPSVLQET